MSNDLKDGIAASRPQGFRGRGDKYLADVAGGLRRLLLKTQDRYSFSNLQLEWEDVGQLAVALVEYAEDMHADIGMWRSVESAQREFFGTPLPFMVGPADYDTQLTPFDQRRVQHLLWTLLPSLIDGLILNPAHKDLHLMSEVASKFLAERFSSMPKDSGVKKFLSTENRYGWDIKRKLVWLGTKSYLFRFFFDRYLDEINDPAKWVGTTDDFICQECTLWSGMGAIDVLAGALELPASDRTTLRNWYERHTAFYRVLTHKMSGTETEFITARNVINGETYTIRMNTARCEFTPGLLVFGALVPWHGEWYWSGEQQAFGEADETIEAGIRRDMLEKSSAIAYRYCLPEADQARELAREHHSKFVAHFGGDLVRFPDGLSLAAAEQKRLTNEWSKAPPEDVEKAMQSRGLTKPGPTMKFPPDFLRHENGIGAFSHPLEGIEYLLCFNQVISGLQKKGADLTEAEEEALCGALTCSLICPAFVHRLVSEYGAESIAAAFMLRDQPLALSLEVLLRRYKGNHYRRRYPTVSLVVS